MTTEPTTCDLCGAEDKHGTGYLLCRTCGALCCPACLPAGRGTECASCEDER